MVRTFLALGLGSLDQGAVLEPANPGRDRGDWRNENVALSPHESSLSFTGEGK